MITYLYGQINKQIEKHKDFWSIMAKPGKDLQKGTIR